MLEKKMKNPLHMVQLSFLERDVSRSAQIQGVPRRVGDLGYVLHGHLNELFGELAPRPFYASARRGQVSVFGYGQADDKTLEQQMQLGAKPTAFRSVRELASKPMPATWSPGCRLAFEVRVCPTVRNTSVEQDAYLARLKQLDPEDPKPNREEVYTDWLARRLRDAARLERCVLNELRLVHLFRRHQKGQSRRRRNHSPRYPETLLSGELTVSHGSSFADLLARGIGRHRAFGFGMLRVRPVRRSKA